MIKILHIYPKTNAMIAQYVDMAEKGMSDNFATASAVDKKSARQMCKDWQPDIVHLHGCHDSELLQAANYAVKQGARLVVNPHGDLQPWVLKGILKQDIRWRTLRNAIRHTYALIAQSKAEADNLMQLAWNDRVETIVNPIITRTTDAAHLAAMICNIYNKVMASDVLTLMDDDTLEALRLLLKAGITGDERWLEKPFTLSPDWQKLYVYAQYEGIAPVLNRGIEVLNLMVPEPLLSPIYLPNDYQQPAPSRHKEVLPLVRMIKEETEQGSLSVLRLVELDRLLRRTAPDEEVLLIELDGAKLRPFFASLLQILAEQTGLDEGFMPCQPLDNKVTQEIRTTITNHLKI